jgi:hypothetical protein
MATNAAAAATSAAGRIHAPEGWGLLGGGWDGVDFICWSFLFPGGFFRNFPARNGRGIEESANAYDYPTFGEYISTEKGWGECAGRISTENPEVPRHGSSGFFTTEGTEGHRETAGEDGLKPAVLLVAADCFARPAEAGTTNGNE